jgi:hypothetical protein
MRTEGERAGQPLSGTEVTFYPVGHHLRPHRLRPEDAGAPAARAGLPELGRGHQAARRPPRREVRGNPALRGRGRGLRAPPGQVQDADPQGRHRHPRQEGRDRDRSRPVVERQLPRDHAVLHQQHPPAGWRHPPVGLPRLADARHGRLYRGGRRGQEGEGFGLGRGRPRRPDLRPVGQGAGPQILVTNQGQAGLVRGASGRGGPVLGRPVDLVRGTSGRGPPGRRQDHRGRRRPRGRAQGPRPDPPQDGDGNQLPARASWPTVRNAIRPSPNCSSSRATAPAARPNRPATARTRPSCPCAARS